MKLKELIENPINLQRPEGVSNKQWVRALQLYEAAKNVGDKFPELTVAQAALETGWFKKESGKNNFFGQKASKSQEGSSVATHEVINGERIAVQDRFRDYDSIENALLDRKDKWMSKYANASTPQEAISKIWRYDNKKKQGVGYATDPEYGKKVNTILSMMGVSSDKPEPYTYDKTDKEFEKWYSQNTLEGRNNVPYSNDLSYDYYSFYKNGDYKNKNFNIEQHFPDTYKRPTHPTFSNESIYSTRKNPGGSWIGEKYIKPAPQEEYMNQKVKDKIPPLATPPINPNYAVLPEAEKQEARKEQAISEEQIRTLLEQERQATEKRFLTAFQQQNAQEQPEYTPQPEQQDLSHLYNYINLED